MDQSHRRKRKTPSGRAAKRPLGQILVACNRCRRLKRRCDGARPSCENCRTTNLICQYDTASAGESRPQAVQRQHDDLQASQQAAHSSLSWLIAQPTHVALSYLERLKNAEDPTLELNSIAAEGRGRRLPPVLSTPIVQIGSLPLARDMLSAELISRYPASFPPLLEIDLDLLHEQPSSLEEVSESKPPTRSRRAFGALTSVPRPKRIPPEVCDARLHDLQIPFWTTVPISNELAAHLISAYLQIEHPVYGFFDPDLFLQDLLTQNVRYCSPLLVNSLLFWTCCTFGPIYSGASCFATAFLESSQRLLHAEHNNNSELNVASLMILALGCISFGKDKLAQKLMVASIRMGEEMFLIGEQRRPAEKFHGVSRDTLSMLSYVAWGTFNFSAVYLLHFHDVHSGTFTKCPPLLPKPGSHITSRETDLTDQYPQPVSQYLGTTFPFFCRFWCIAHEMASVLYSSSGPIHEHVPLAFAESKLHSFLEWAEDLPPQALRSKEMTHNVAEMHICYHATIMDLFRPFLARKAWLSTFSTKPQRPEAIFRLSLGHLKVLSQYYYKSFTRSPEAHTISWVHGPLYVAPAILRYERHQGWESEFLSFLEACSDLFQSHKVLEGFLRALLGMAISAGAFTLPRAKEYLDILKAARKDEQPSEIPQTGFVVDQDLSMEDRNAAVGDVLAQRFDEMLFVEDLFEQGQV